MARGRGGVARSARSRRSAKNQKPGVPVLMNAGTPILYPMSGFPDNHVVDINGNAVVDINGDFVVNKRTP